MNKKIKINMFSIRWLLGRSAQALPSLENNQTKSKNLQHSISGKCLKYKIKE